MKNSIPFFPVHGGQVWMKQQQQKNNNNQYKKKQIPDIILYNLNIKSIEKKYEKWKERKKRQTHWSYANN